MEPKPLTDKQTQWLIRHFKHTKNDDIAARFNISLSHLHRLARLYGLKKTHQFMTKTQANAAAFAKIAIANEDDEEKERRKQQARDNGKKNRFKPGTYALANKTPEEMAAIQAKKVATWKATRRADEIRLNWGREQKTKFHFGRHPDRDKNTELSKLRCYLRKMRGYHIPGKAGMVIYITADTKRSPRQEQKAQRLGMLLREKQAI